MTVQGKGITAKWGAGFASAPCISAAWQRRGAMSGVGHKRGRTQYEHMFSALHLKLGHCSIASAARASLGPRKTRLGATVCFSKLELTLHGSLVLSLAADVVVLPLHTRH